MPLHQGSSDEVVSKNISMLVHEGRPQRQAIAIAMREAGRPKQKKTAAEIAAEIAANPAKVAAARIFMRSLAEKKANLASQLFEQAAMNPTLAGAALGTAAGAAGGAAMGGEGNRLSGAAQGALAGGLGGAALGGSGALAAAGRGGQDLYSKLSPLAAGAMKNPASVPADMLIQGAERAGLAGMGAAGLGTGAVLGGLAGSGEKTASPVNDILRRALGGGALGAAGGAGLGALSAYMRDDNVGRGALRGATAGGALGALGGGLHGYAGQNNTAMGMGIGKAIEGIGAGLGMGAAATAGAAAFGSPETREMRDKELGKFQAMQEIRQYQGSHLAPLHDAAFAKAQSDEIISRADPAMMQSAFNTMKKFAPNLAADHNAVTSFLRESASFGTGPNYATLKNLADAEKAVVSAGGTPSISF